MDDDRTQNRTHKHCDDRPKPSRQSRVVAVRERRVRADARNRLRQDGPGQIRDCQLPDGGIPRAHGQRRQRDQNKGLKRSSRKSPLYPTAENDAARRKATSSRNAFAANRTCELAGFRAMTLPPIIAPTRKAKSAVNERAMDSPGVRAVANATSTTFPVMFAVKTRPSDRKLTASTRPVTPIIPSKTYNTVFSVLDCSLLDN